MERHDLIFEVEGAKKARMVEIMAMLTMAKATFFFFSNRMSNTLVDVP